MARRFSWYSSSVIRFLARSSARRARAFSGVSGVGAAAGGTLRGAGPGGELAGGAEVPKDPEVVQVQGNHAGKNARQAADEHAAGAHGVPVRADHANPDHSLAGVLPSWGHYEPPDHPADDECEDKNQA